MDYPYIIKITSALRTRKQQDVQSYVRAFFERLRSEPAYAQMNRYIYATLHHFHPKDEPFSWETVPEKLLEELAGEPRASIGLEGVYLSADANINCTSKIIKEKIEGKLRRVPEPNNGSSIHIRASQERFLEPGFSKAYLALCGDLFEMIQGEYGWAEHVGMKHGNDYDRDHADLFQPWFIAWANFFGPLWVERLGRQKLLSAPAWEVFELPHDSIVLTVASNPLEQRKPEIQETIQRVKEHLEILSPSEKATSEELTAYEVQHRATEAEMSQRISLAFREARKKTMEEMIRQAEGCVQGVEQFFGEKVDFSLASLKIIDRVLTTGFNVDEDEETIETAVQAFGAYLGEVLRRNCGGEWRDEEMKGQPVIIKIGGKTDRVAPFAIVDRIFRERHRGIELPISKWFEDNMR